MVGWGWSRCPRNNILSDVAKHMANSWLVAVGSQSTQIVQLLGPFLDGFRDVSRSQGATKSWLQRGSQATGERYIDVCMYEYKYTVLHPEALEVRNHINRHAYLSNS